MVGLLFSRTHRLTRAPRGHQRRLPRPAREGRVAIQRADLVAEEARGKDLRLDFLDVRPLVHAKDVDHRCGALAVLDDSALGELLQLEDACGNDEKTERRIVVMGEGKSDPFL